ncbi:hypothetical protein D3C80_1643250 [compost metagenome]
MVFHHQCDVLAVSDQRYSVAAHQVVHRQHHRLEHLRQPRLCAQAGTGDVGGDQRFTLIVGFHQRRHQDRLLVGLQITGRVFTPDHPEHFLITVGSLGQRAVGWVGQIARRRFTQDLGAAGLQSAVAGENLL